MQKIRIKLTSYDHKLVDKSTEKIIRTVKPTGCSDFGTDPAANQEARSSR